MYLDKRPTHILLNVLELLKLLRQLLKIMILSQLIRQLFHLIIRLVYRCKIKVWRWRGSLITPEVVVHYVVRVASRLWSVHNCAFQQNRILGFVD